MPISRFLKYAHLIYFCAWCQQQNIESAKILLQGILEDFAKNKYTYGTIICSHIRSHRKPQCLHKVNMSRMIRKRAEYMSWCQLCTSKHCTLIWVCSVRPLFSIAAMSLWKRSRACFSSPKIGSNTNSKVLHYTCTCSVSTK